VQFLLEVAIMITRAGRQKTYLRHCSCTPLHARAPSSA